MRESRREVNNKEVSLSFLGRGLHEGELQGVYGADPVLAGLCVVL